MRERLEEIFDTLKMNEIRDVLGTKMSTGMKQKVSIARTVVHDPPVLIFDEPTSGVDVLVARAVLEAVEQLRDRGQVHHFFKHTSCVRLKSSVDRVAIIHKGCILASGTVEELTDEYRQPDIEEVFFELIRQHDSMYAATA